MNDNVRALPNEERDTLLAALENLKRTMPMVAKSAKVMMDEFQEAGFTEDQALRVVAYSLFHED